VPKEGEPERSRPCVILSRQAKDPHRPDRGPSAGTTKILRLTLQDDIALPR